MAGYPWAVRQISAGDDFHMISMWNTEGDIAMTWEVILQYWFFVSGIHRLPVQRFSNVKISMLRCRLTEVAVEKKIEMLVLSDKRHNAQGT